MPKEAINFTDSAAHKVYALIKEEGNCQLKLRVFISGGGCSGFQYGFTFDENAKDDDVKVTKAVAPDNETKDDDNEGNSSVTLVIDPLSFQYLKGADIDYREDINGAQFIIRNPNAKTTCGCGSSFAA